MTLDLALVQAIDQRVAAGEKMLAAMGTVTSWLNTAPSDVMVTFDSTTAAVPCKVFGDVTVAEGDRVGLLRLGRWWTVVGSFTKRWTGVLGGNRWTGGGNLVTGLTTTELVIMTTPFMFVPSATQVEVSAGIRLLDTVSSGSTYVFRLRDGATTGGTQRGEYTWTSPNLLFGYNYYFWGGYDMGASPAVQQYCLTAQRVGGTGQLTMIAGGPTHNVHLIARAVATASTVTLQATP